MELWITYFVWFIFGIAVNYFFNYFNLLFKKSRALSEKVEYFKYIIKTFENGVTKFKYRIDNNVFISSSIPFIGKVDILYQIDKWEIFIIKDNKVISSSIGLKNKMIEDLILLINKNYYFELNDNINVGGYKISKSYIDSVLNNANMSNTIEQVNKTPENESMRAIDLDIDDILDKISKMGLNSLTPGELMFLKKYSEK
jgi:hypothetical protein